MTYFGWVPDRVYRNTGTEPSETNHSEIKILHFDLMRSAKLATRSAFIDDRCKIGKAESKFKR